MPLLTNLGIEDPCSPDSSGQGISDRKEVHHFQIRSLTPQQAAGNALAFSVHDFALADPLVVGDMR
jgi:hypothetical protein